MKVDVKSLKTEELYDNIVTLSQTMELLTKGQYPGAVANQITNSLTYIDRFRGQFVEEFIARPDAREKYPQSFEDPTKPNHGVQGIQGA